MKKGLKKKKGFTLIELIVVIAILGILALIAIPKLTGVQADAKIKSDNANGKIIADAVSMALTKETIVLNGSVYKGTKSTTKTDYTTTAISLSNAEEVKDELASIPKPQQAGSAGTFYVKISADGKIIVYRNAGTDNAGTDIVYPQ